jgi:RNA 2',3'-cyclic 3'-phosphodiesterase
VDVDGGGPGTPRLFVAVELSEEWRAWFARAIRRLRDRIPDGYRWVRPELLHITLIFLGNQPCTELPRIVEAVRLAVAGRPKFSLTIGQVGGFGGTRPRVLWVSVGDPTNALPMLRRELGLTLDGAAISYDRKPLVPHITIARARAPVHLAPNSLSVPLGSPPELVVSEISVVRSDLRTSGPRYTAVAHLPLASVPRA